MNRQGPIRRGGSCSWTPTTAGCPDNPDPGRVPNRPGSCYRPDRRGHHRRQAEQTSSGSGGDLAVWALADGRELFRIKNFTSMYYYKVQVAFSPDGRRLAGADGTGVSGQRGAALGRHDRQELMVLSWDGGTGQVPTAWPSIRPDGALLLPSDQCFPHPSSRSTSLPHLTVLDASPLPPETLAGERIDAMPVPRSRCTRSCERSWSRTRACPPRSVPPYRGPWRAASRVCPGSGRRSGSPGIRTDRWRSTERALRHAEAAGAACPDDRGCLRRLGMALAASIARRRGHWRP